MIIELFIIGLIVGFLFFEFTGYSPGGVIAPAYLALFIHQPSKIANTVVIALLVFFIIRFLSARLILYGRRKFLIALILSFFIKLLITCLIQPIPVIAFDLQSIGYIIPGLIAHEMGRQKPVPTILSLGIVALLVFQISLIIR